MGRSVWIIIWGMAATVAISSCSTDDPGDRMDFDQAPMLENLSANLIIPAYDQLATTTLALDEAMSQLINDPTETRLDEARSALKTARLAWQACSFYQMGPAENNGLSAILNLYPLDESQVDRNIAEGETNLETAANADARGFPALGYLLLNGEGADILEAISNNASYSAYLKAITELIHSKAASTLMGWREDGGNYQAQFNTSLGVAVGSSVGQLANAFIQDYERNIRDAKVGIPVGIRSLGVEIPENVEALYGGYSKELLSESINQLQRMYQGGSGPGFDDYLEELSAITTDNEDLSQAIDQQFSDIKTAISMVSDPLSEAIVSDKEGVQNIFVEMQELAVLLKTDMASQIGIAITFQDSDGD